MITELVFLELRKGITREEVMSLYRQTAPAWAKNPDLLSKYYFFNEEQSLGGGVYVWTSKEAALRWHGEEYRPESGRYMEAIPAYRISTL